MTVSAMVVEAFLYVEMKNQKMYQSSIRKDEKSQHIYINRIKYICGMI